MSHLHSYKSLHLLFTLLSTAALAAPDAGTLLQQIPSPNLPTPATPAQPRTVAPEEPLAPQVSERFFVKTIQIAGNKKIATATLHALVADAEGKNLTLEELQTTVSRISDYYQRQGYPLARAIIPAQTITDGLVKVQIILARYGEIKVNNTSGVRDRLIAAPLAALQTAQDIEQAPLDRALLLISDLPGISLSSSFTRGEDADTSDFQINVAASPRAYGQLVLDGYGSSYTGRERLSSTVVFNDPLKLRNSDILSVSVLSSGPGMRYGRLSYEAFLTGDGVRLGGSTSSLQYQVQGSFGTSGSEGSAQVSSLWAKQTFLRQRDLNLYGQLQLDALTLADTTSEGINNRRLQNFTVTLNGDARDVLLTDRENFSTWNLGVTRGRDSRDSEGEFFRLNANLNRLQRLTAKDSLYFNYTRQWANRHLDSSQQMSVAGPNSVRASDTGISPSGDSASMLNAEYRRELGTILSGQLTGLVFYDKGDVTINKHGSGENNRFTLNGPGLGLTWAGPDSWSAKAFAATPTGKAATVSGAGTATATRLWMEIGRGF